MSHNHGHGQICIACMVRRCIVTMFEREAQSGEIDDWINGIMDAAALIAGAHVTAGKEAAERAVLQEHIGISFDFRRRRLHPARWRHAGILAEARRQRSLPCQGGRPESRRSRRRLTALHRDRSSDPHTTAFARKVDDLPN